jgi:hypothetical protein
VGRGGEEAPSRADRSNAGTAAARPGHGPWADPAPPVTLLLAGGGEPAAAGRWRRALQQEMVGAGGCGPARRWRRAGGGRPVAASRRNRAGAARACVRRPGDPAPGWRTTPTPAAPRSSQPAPPSRSPSRSPARGSGPGTLQRAGGRLGPGSASVRPGRSVRHHRAATSDPAAGRRTTRAPAAPRSPSPAQPLRSPLPARGSGPATRCQRIRAGPLRFRPVHGPAARYVQGTPSILTIVTAPLA